MGKQFCLSGIKNLAGQTLWYGLPSITSRFLGYLMNLSLPLFFSEPAVTADLTLVYAATAFLNILFTYGMETAYFRFIQGENRSTLYSTLSITLFITTLVFSFLLWINQDQLVGWARLEASPELIQWMIGILFFDTLSTLAFAKLRQENRPRRFAFAKMATVVINVSVVVVCLGIIPRYFPAWITISQRGIEWYLIGNFLGSIGTLLLLIPELKQVQLILDTVLLKKVLQYSWPLVIVGMGGIVNDMLSRLLYQFVVDLPVEEAKHELGVFGNIIRLSIVITIAIQAFRLAAEPFFFNRSKDKNAPEIYARVLKYFVIVCCFLFLSVSLYIDVAAWFFEAINRERWKEGLYVVPFFAMANILLGIYYNLSIWYKLTNRNLTGAFITIGGALITIVFTIFLIPRFHYWGAAMASFSCYLFMLVVSYALGQKHFPVPYPVKRILFYLLGSGSLYLLHRSLVTWYNNPIFNLSLASVLLLLFIGVVKKTEKKEWAVS
ncbi:MAG: lipopolysaccharide biosynthesis protein [Bacteroidota bacterium]